MGRMARLRLGELCWKNERRRITPVYSASSKSTGAGKLAKGLMDVVLSRVPR